MKIRLCGFTSVASYEVTKERQGDGGFRLLFPSFTAAALTGFFGNVPVLTGKFLVGSSSDRSKLVMGRLLPHEKVRFGKPIRDYKSEARNAFFGVFLNVFLVFHFHIPLIFGDF